jgi:hypothetical protein
MATSKHRKNHKKKLKARKDKETQQKNKMKKMQREFIMNLIKAEQEKGLFDNSTPLNPTQPTIEGPSVTEGPIIEGPSI